MKPHIILYIIIYLCSISCSHKKGITTLTSLPNTLSEISGIVKIKDHIIAINDSGNSPSLWVYTPDQPLVELQLKDVKNHDWEDLAYDPEKQMLYVGDFGNNKNKRKDLAIYQVSLKGIDLSQSQEIQARKIPFYYEDQTKFPPKKKNLRYDCESFIVYKDYFYLFTRNRSSNFDGTTTVYQLPINGSLQKAIQLTRIKICNDPKDCQVTAASHNNNGTIALLTSDKIFTITDYDLLFTNYQINRHELEHYSHKESIDFIDNQQVIIADEKDKNTGGKLYKYTLK